LHVKKSHHFNRREFLQAGALATVGISLGANQEGKQKKYQKNLIRRRF